MSNEKLRPEQPIVTAERRDGSAATIELYLPEELLYFDGHFEGYPVLPGVVQVHWAVGFARRFFNIADAMPSKMQVKFRDLIRPRQTLSLELRHDPEKNRLSFEYRDSNGARSSGQIVFGL